jgi:hypothetical protein
MWWFSLLHIPYVERVYGVFMYGSGQLDKEAFGQAQW